MSLDARAKAIAALREHSRARAKIDARVAHAELMAACQSLLDDFRAEFNPPGARYWEGYSTHVPPKRSYHTTAIGEQLHAQIETHKFAELTHIEYLARQGVRDPSDWHKESL